MIVFENKGFETRSDKPDTDWTGAALYIIPDNSDLAQKIQTLYPYYDFVTDSHGDLIDVEPIEHPPEPPPQPSDLELKIKELEEIVYILTGGRDDELDSIISNNS